MGEVVKKKYYGTFEIARLCQVSPASVNRWIKSGKIKASLTVGGHQRVTSETLVKLLKELNLPIPDELSSEQGIKILIIDDEESMRKFLRVFFDLHFENVEVQEVSDGFEAGMKIVSFLPDVVTLDVKLPGMDGFSVCKLIKGNPETEHIKVIGISGQTSKEVADRMLQSGADAFLIKPIDQNELRQKILELLG